MKDDLISLLQSLVSMKTISGDHTENKKALNWVKDELKGLPSVFCDINSEGFPSLLITTKETKIPKLWLMAHIDVVGGSDKIFTPEINGQKLYGRGTFDMKFAIACYIKLVKEIGQDLPNYNFGVMLTSDEEIGGKNGTGYLVSQGYESSVGFLPDGGDNWTIQESAKGVYQIVVNAIGKPSHGAKPWAGVNAIETLLDFLKELRASFVKEPCGDDKHIHPTLNIGKISGGDATNQVAAHADTHIDIRVPSLDALNEVKRKLDELKTKHTNISTDLIYQADPYSNDKNNPYIQSFLTLLSKEFNIHPSFRYSHGTTDARYFLSKNIPVILVKPLGGSIHSEEEWIDIQSLDTYYEVLKKFVLDNFKN